MDRFVSTFSLALMCLGTSWPAFGDWEYTRYGMTAEEIVAASEGKARILSDEEKEGRSTSGYSAIATARHKTGPFRFRVVFGSKLGDSRLTAVRLTLEGTKGAGTKTKVNDLIKALTSNYGSPINKSEEKVQFLTRNSWAWQGDSDNVQLVYIETMEELVWVEYTERLDDLAL